MTTGTAPDKTWQRCWASEQLGVDPTATLPQVRAVFLHRLQEADFVPPPLWPQAVAILEGRKSPMGEREAQRDEQERLRGQIELFAERFWSFSIDERRHRWAELVQSCEVAPMLRVRLNALKDGLDINPMAPEGTEIANLVRSVKELFVLRPPQRAARRRELLVAALDNRETWQSAAVLRKYHADVAALEPVFLSELAKGSNRLVQRERAREALFRPRKRNAVAEPAPAAPSSGGKKLGRFGWGVIIVMVGTAIRACAGLHSDSSTSGNNLRPAYEAPKFSPVQVPQWSPPQKNSAWSDFDPDDPVIRSLLGTKTIRADDLKGSAGSDGSIGASPGQAGGPGRSPVRPPGSSGGGSRSP